MVPHVDVRNRSGWAAVWHCQQQLPPLGAYCLLTHLLPSCHTWHVTFLSNPVYRRPAKLAARIWCKVALGALLCVMSDHVRVDAGHIPDTLVNISVSSVSFAYRIWRLQGFNVDSLQEGHVLSSLVTRTSDINMLGVCCRACAKCMRAENEPSLCPTLMLHVVSDQLTPGWNSAMMVGPC